MIREKSCGAVVYTRFGAEIRYLIVQMQLGHFGFPKGHVEGEETEIQTAAREIQEETGVDPVIDPNFRKSVEYSPYEGCVKEVVYFFASANDPAAVRQEAEIKEILWLSFERALAALTYENDRKILIAAHDFIKGR